MRELVASLRSTLVLPQIDRCSNLELKEQLLLPLLRLQVYSTLFCIRTFAVFAVRLMGGGSGLVHAAP